MPEDLEKLLTEKEVAELLGMSVAWLQRQRWAGVGIPYTKHGRAVRYEPQALRTWINQHRQAELPRQTP